MTRRLIVIAMIALAVAPALAATSGVRPSEEDTAALATLAGTIVGQIAWESNRDGHWQLYTMNADGTGARRLTTGSANDTGAHFSTDGARLLFTREADGHSDVWVINSDGSGERKLIDNAFRARWRKGDSVIQFIRKPNPGKNVRHTLEYDLATGEERLLFPLEGARFEMEIRVAMGNDEGTRFVAWSPRPRGTWLLSPDGQLQKLVHPGCEGQVAADQRYAYGVHNSGRFVRFNLADGEDMLPFKERTGAWSHTYFPRVSRDSKWLIYGACPPDQHAHDTSDYEIFLVPLRDWATPDEPVRLTFNKRTDRWPDIFVAPAGARNPLADGPCDVASNPATNPPEPPPPPLAIATFSSDGATPDWGGQSGLWPQVEGCQGEATWLAGDAQGAEGGSMRITYEISAAPRSFAMWFTPAAPVDLSRHDRFVIYARGDVPSFTLVVKDATSDPEGATDKGIADYLVGGVTADWQRFEFPFVGFKSRLQGGSIDWSRLNHAAVALVHPANAPAGRLHVDNLRALAAPD